jgi:hypothetical protein
VKRMLSIAIAPLALAALLWISPATSQADECEPAVPSFGFCHLDMTFTGEEGSPQMQAGSHPFAQTITIEPNTEINPDPKLGKVPIGLPRELRVELPPGFTGSPDATPQCSAAGFSKHVQEFLNSAGETVNLGGAALLPDCPDVSAVGLIKIRGANGGGSHELELATPVYNLVPPPGVAARLGFSVTLVGTVIVDLRVKQTPPYNLIATIPDITQMHLFYGADTTLWSDPGSPAHNDDRGICGAEFNVEGEGKHDLGDFLGVSCPASLPPLAFFTLPRTCTGPLVTLFEADSWEGEHATGEAQTHGPFGEPLGLGGCEHLGFAPQISALPTSHSASSPSGLDFEVDVHDHGLTDPRGIANSDVKKAVVTLPRGVTVNPGQAEGLGTCSEADFAREAADSQFGAGCPAASKIGSVEVETPLLHGVLLRGSVFVATPNDPATAAQENPFNSLIALYVTIKEPERGINLRLQGKVEPDPRTGQLVATFDDLPQQPFSHFRFHFREGGRSPLITPPLCGAYTTEAQFTPWADPSRPLTTTASFTIDHGVDGGPCPAAGTPPFAPGFTAGTLSNAAGAYSPFYASLTRRDGDQDLTKVSATLPLGVVAKLAGVDRCPEAQIALAKTKSGKAELASPSCPANSQIGEAIGGAGVGSQLTYVRGKVYLAGPYNGAPLSMVEVVPAVAGPFDVGDVVVRQALRIDPRTAEVRVDGDRSDPIPHILAGIPLAVRDIRVNVNRPDFTLNPTSCAPSRVDAEIWGGGADVFSSLDDSPVAREAPFQAAGCRGLGFKPDLSLRLKGGVRRGAHPKLRGVFRPRPGDANLEELVLRLPHSAFLDQAHIRTICTRVQFAAKSCPQAAIYGHVRAATPLLSEPLEGPAYLRSSNHNLPDLVFALHGLVDFETVARIDSKNGGIRATFTDTPDAPISEVVVDMQGAKKGLIVNSANLCAAKHPADAQMSAHNGRQSTSHPLVRASCGR